MFAVVLALLLSAGTLEAMHNDAPPSWVSPTLDAPAYRPGLGYNTRYLD